MKATFSLLLLLALVAPGQAATTVSPKPPEPSDADFPTPAPSARHEEKVAAIKAGHYDLVLIGDSITHSIGELDGKYEPLKEVWQRHFAPRHAINLGHNGYRTEQILWNLQNGELDFAESPKVVILLIGTNNSDDRHFSKVHTAEEIFAGTKAIVELIRQRHPTTKILVLRIFPRGGDGEKGVSPPAFNSSAQCIETCRRAGELTAQLADGKQVFWLDVNHVFLRPDGTINTDLMWDLLHPSPAGAEAWAQAIEPTLAQLMGDKPLAVEAPSNSALFPVTKLENESHDRYARHEDVLRVKDGLNPEVVALWPDQAPVGIGAFEKADVRITVYRSASPNGAAVVICPGGGYGGLVTGAEGSGIAQWLNAHGVTGIVLEYRLPHGRAFVPLLDAQRAIRMVRAKGKEWGCDPRRIGIIGFSAGGHLASTAATHFDAGDAAAADPIERVGCRPDFAILVYPVITMSEQTHGGTKQNLLGPSPSPETVELFSNDKQVTAETPPTFLAHALDDKVVSPENSRQFYKALQKHKVPSRYLELPSGDHGLNGYKGPMWDAWQSGALKWLASLGLIPDQDAVNRE
jgi:acetyl esterase/lipase/lysophospholipase L1-like esterase